MINYKTKITNNRTYGDDFKNIEISTESNRGRIINSPAVRRLQQKTQVFPLEINAAVRSRLTHSLEVQQNARYIAQVILSKIKEANQIEEFKLNDLDNAFISTVEMASLMHDIGNPPFGHFGELAINEWMSTVGKNCFKTSVESQEIKYSHYESHELLKKLLIDLCNFDGNAQGIRLVQTLQDLNLTYSQVASILKYTRVAYKDKSDVKYTYLGKKVGYYYSEENYIKDLRSTLNMNDEARFPLTYIMEAADDISYGIADLEDAVDKGILTLRKLYVVIEKECKDLDKDNYLLNIAKEYYEKHKDKKYLSVNSFIIDFRVKIVTDLVLHSANKYIENHNEIFNGTYDAALLEDNSKYHLAIKILKNVARKHVFNHPDIETLEIRGHSAIKGLFKCYKPLLELSEKEFKKLINEESENFISKRLFNRLSKKHLNAYYKQIEKIKDRKDTNYKEFIILEWYYRARLFIDFISGMTDEYAINEYQTLSAI